jgi:ArsR family transcriptional regulator
MDAGRFQRIAKALADPRRFEIFEHIASAGDDLCCGKIVERFPVAQPTISHHLKELAEAGLVEIRPAGQFRYFRARRDVLSQYIEELRRRSGIAASTETSENNQRSLGFTA